MVASGDRVSHVNGWSFHSDLPELTQDANMDSAQLLPAASGGASGSRSLEPWEPPQHESFCSRDLASKF